jgi:hypothetical protein
MSRPRVKCPRCNKRRTLQSAISWRPTPESEPVPVCGACWGELFTAAQLYHHAVVTPGVTLRLERSE